VYCHDVRLLVLCSWETCITVLFKLNAKLLVRHTACVVLMSQNIHSSKTNILLCVPLILDLQFVNYSRRRRCPIYYGKLARHATYSVYSENDVASSLATQTVRYFSIRKLLNYIFNILSVFICQWEINTYTKLSPLP
jgi:hypothetical protein